MSKQNINTTKENSRNIKYNIKYKECKNKDNAQWFILYSDLD